MRISDWSSDVCSSDLAEKHMMRHLERGCTLLDVGPHILLGQPRGGIDECDDQLATNGIGNTHHIGVAHIGMSRDQLLDLDRGHVDATALRSEEHTSELQSLMRISYAVFCLKKK